jgi:hypothetical protein
VFTAEIIAETRTHGVPISSLYRHTCQESLPAVVAWVNNVTRAYTKATVAYVTVTDNDTLEVVKRYRWECPNNRRPWNPPKRKRR